MDRPFVLVNMASTLDGKITSAAREYPRFTSPNDRLRMDRLRAGADAIVVGAGTLRADDPLLHVRDPELARQREARGKGGLLKVVVTASARIDPRSRFFGESDGGARILATVEDAPSERLAPLAGRAEIWRLGRGRVDLPELCRRLRERGVERLLLEGGGALNWDFLHADLVDEIHVTIAPCLLGGREAPTLLEGQGFPMGAQRRLRLVECEREGDELFGCWVVIR
jgi:2,5-diamino-6-(ribosylamino)-4(3H)-pyrimidinone 5'-phosphate reductase